MQNTSLNIRVLSTYSQARFIRTFLKTVPDATTINGKSISDVTTDLNAGLEDAKNAVIAGRYSYISGRIKQTLMGKLSSPGKGII